MVSYSCCINYCNGWHCPYGHACVWLMAMPMIHVHCLFELPVQGRRSSPGWDVDGFAVWNAHSKVGALALPSSESHTHTHTTLIPLTPAPSPPPQRGRWGRTSRVRRSAQGANRSRFRSATALYFYFLIFLAIDVDTKANISRPQAHLCAFMHVFRFLCVFLLVEWILPMPLLRLSVKQYRWQCVPERATRQRYATPGADANSNLNPPGWHRSHWTSRMRPHPT